MYLYHVYIDFPIDTCYLQFMLTLFNALAVHSKSWAPNWMLNKNHFTFLGVSQDFS